MSLRFFFSFACVVVLAPASSWAATAAQQRTSTDSAARKPTLGKEQARPLNTVRVTASRTDKGYAGSGGSAATRTSLSLRDTPRSVSVVTHQLIADQSMQNMADVVRYVPGVSMASGEGHRDAPTIRGNNTTADFFVDGMRDDAQYLRDLYNVERVEVLKGPEALLFGRGGGGGVINRVTRQAGWAPVVSFNAEGGSFDHKRGVLDLGQGLSSNFAARMLGMYERSGGFRDAANLTRYGVNPTLAVMAGPRTLVRLGYELFDDERRVDRGMPSYHGRPFRGDITSFYGNPSLNHGDLRLDLLSASIEHHTHRGITLRNRTTLGDYDKFYQNALPGAVNTGGTSVALSAYNHAIQRLNLLNVADATFTFSTGALRHTLLTGADLSRQRTNQVRSTGYFNDSSATYSVPLSQPTITTPVTFRQSATDADNVTIARDAAVYVQDQIAFSSNWLAIVGARSERFDIDYHNNRTGQNLSRLDRLLSPRAGLVFKPVEPVSLYASYGVSQLPSSGDQFTSLTVTSATLEPERFRNREVGAKWEVHSHLALNAALYRLDRTNTVAPDPNGSGLSVQTGAQRTTGWELGASGSPTRAWQLAVGVASQRATIVSTTSAARSGATVALVPHSTLSLWNRYQVTNSIGVGLGVVHRTDMFAAVDNTVTLPGFTRVDGALYAELRPGLRAQVNLENLLDTRYYATTQGNNNIMPGAPRSLRLAVVVSR